MTCRYCERKIANKGSLAAHEVSCRSNPDRKPHRRGVGAGRKKGSVGWSKGLKIGPHKRWLDLFPNESVFVENSTYPRHCLKKRILDEGLIAHICAECGLGPEWRGKPMPLILDHENGINNDNRLTNLRFVCSNCDTQLPTYKSKNRK